MKPEHSRMEYVRLTMEEYEENYQIIKSLEKTIEVFKKKNEELLQKSAKHGEWIGEPPTKHWCCSKCNSMTTTAHYCWNCYFEYCPYCGAKMDKE